MSTFDEKTTDMASLKIKWLKFLYGDEITYALVLDNILFDLNYTNISKKKAPMNIFSYKKNNSNLEQLIYVSRRGKDLDYLEKIGYVRRSSSSSPPFITEEGLSYIAKGGFTTEAKKSKNALFSFRISIVAITISLLTFLIQLFNWLK